MKSLYKILLFSLIISIFIIACKKHVKVLPLSEIYINMPDDGYEVKVTDTLVISPKITYDYNSTYTWVVNDEVISEEKDLEYNPQKLEYLEAIFMMENERGSDTIKIMAQSMYNTDFEDLELYENTGTEKDTLWTNEEGASYFIADSIKFEVNGSYADEDPWTGFTYSNLTGSNSKEEYEKYSCYKAPSSFESTNFGVMMQDTVQTPVILETVNGKDHLFKSIAINNSYYVYDAIKYGNNGSKTFGGEDGTEKDSLLIAIAGYNSSGSHTGTVGFYLANYTFENNRENYIITTWTTVELDVLGKVSKLVFSLISSDMDDGVMKTPGFVCIDEIKIIE